MAPTGLPVMKTPQRAETPIQSSSGSAFDSWDDSAPPSPLSRSVTPSGNASRTRGRAANAYDAVAGWFQPYYCKNHPADTYPSLPGRVTLNGALSDSETASGRSKRRLSVTADRYSARNPKLAPEEALFRRKNAPVRYAEHDIYWANEDLPDAGRRHLPDGSLLKSVHGYASRFYDAAAARLGPRCRVGTRAVDERSMDETALLAFGILLEEAGREALGRKGDLVFTEPATTESRAVAKTSPDARVPGCTSEDTQGNDIDEVTVPASQNPQRAKRRKLVKSSAPLETPVS
ncbi:hypothetical protein N658DRAFT_251040 [Parathielavia hyrcaniae]|uniref:Uncharacterized protein n=1 Tax=Parathielavia hyrcaniae TaxID=113614 RepID=A0AAN6T4W7_9PEZI|nr:hypothetical protein N658DRAFT_251040 [Parathielavia hyrcaniae]